MAAKTWRADKQCDQYAMKKWPLFIAFMVIVSVTSYLCAAVSAQQSLSDDAFEKLKTNVQTELEARYTAAQGSDELFPGATVALALRGGRVAGFAIGFADMDRKLSMSAGSRMPSGSIGKSYVAALALSMVADGSLDLDGKIGTWLADEPWFGRLPNGDTITLRHLLNHSSGIIDHVFDTDSQFPDYLKDVLKSDSAGQLIDPRELVHFVLDREPLFPAGTGFHYSDTNYILLGLIIETVSGSTYYQELDERFLVPLNLEQTSPLDRRDIAGLAQGYAIESSKRFDLPPEMLVDGALVFDPAIEWTGGGLATTADDLVRWAMALFAGDALEPQCLAAMLSSIAMPEHDEGHPGRVFGYGLGVNIAKTKHGVAYRHGGFFPGYSSMLAYFPDYGVALAMQINTDKSKIEEHFDAIAGIVVNAVSKTESRQEVNQQ